MPTFTRKTLRQHLGQSYLRDTVVSTTSATGPALVDQFAADTSLTGQSLYVGSWLKHNSMELRVASFNVGSGAYVTGQIIQWGIASGAEYERHDLLPPSEKDRSLDDVIGRLRTRREVGLSSQDGLTFYPLAAAGSPDTIVTPSDVLDVYYYANPTNSLDRERRALAQWQVVQTPTGMELRISPPLSGSYQIALDALVTVTLAAHDAATVTVPDERLVLAGAAAVCWDLLCTRAPGTQRGAYETARGEAARQYSALAARFKPVVSRRLAFDTPVRDDMPRGWWA